MTSPWLDYTRIKVDENSDRWVREEDALRLVDELKIKLKQYRSALSGLLCDVQDYANEESSFALAMSAEKARQILRPKAEVQE